MQISLSSRLISGLEIGDGQNKIFWYTVHFLMEIEGLKSNWARVLRLYIFDFDSYNNLLGGSLNLPVSTLENALRMFNFMIIADIWNYAFHNIIHVVFVLYWLFTYICHLQEYIN